MTRDNRYDGGAFRQAFHVEQNSIDHRYTNRFAKWVGNLKFESSIVVRYISQVFCT